MDPLSRLLQKDDPFLRPLSLAGHSFPGVWRSLFPEELLQMQFPAERQASCSQCPKACYGGFRPDYRCCTYHPQVSNFLLGLASETPAGSRAIDRLLERGMLLPEGMYSSPQQWVDFQDDQSTESFGSSLKVLCPMLDQKSGLCDIHAFRNSVCSTFFCTSDHGRTGESFWIQVQTLGSQIEIALGQWALQAIGFDLDGYFAAFEELAPKIAQVSSAKGWSQEALSKLWGNWAGRERELLRACAAKILEHRHELWDLANRQAIREAVAFDAALDGILPDDLDQEDTRDYVEAEEKLLPAATWDICKEAYERLWTLPDGLFVLSPKLSFEANGQASAEERYHAGKAFFLNYRFTDDQNPPAWRLAVSQEERALLELFGKEPRALDASLWESPAAKALPEPRVFLTEMLNRKALWPFQAGRKRS